MQADMLVQTLRGLVNETVNAGNPSDFLLGTVESVSPLEIKAEQQDLIPEEFLILGDSVRDYEVDIEVDHVTENTAGGSGEAEYASHNHKYTGRKKIKVYNGLKPGEQVILFRQLGGQMFYVASRVKNHKNLSGQWGS